MSPSTSSTSSPRRATFSRRPVAKLSRIRTSCPSRSSRSARLDPMKPPPPVTRTRLMRKVRGPAWRRSLGRGDAWVECRPRWSTFLWSDVDHRARSVARTAVAMSTEARLLTGLALALAVVYWTTPLAIRLADRFEFYDRPAGYKGHLRPTPYLGGTAVVCGFAAAALVLGGTWDRTLPLVLGVLIMWTVGTIDDRRNLTPGLRVALETGVAAALWALGLGWHLGAGGAFDL